MGVVPGADSVAYAVSPARGGGSDELVTVKHLAPTTVSAAAYFPPWSLSFISLLCHLWRPLRFEHTADTIYRFIDRVNAVSLWIETAVLGVLPECHTLPPPRC